MTTEQLQLLAQLELANDERIDSLSKILYNLIEASLDDGKFEGTENILRSEIEQEMARFAAARKRRSNLRKMWGLIDLPTLPDSSVLDPEF